MRNQCRDDGANFFLIAWNEDVAAGARMTTKTKKKFSNEIILTNTFVSIILRHDKTFVTGTIETSISIYTGPVGAVSIVYFTLIYVCFKSVDKKRQPESEREREKKRKSLIFLRKFSIHFPSLLQPLQAP